MQNAPKRRHIPEFGVGRNGGDRQPGAARAADEREGLPPLFLEVHTRGDLRDRAATGIVDPGLRQIQPRAEEPRARAGPEGRGHRDLAIGDLAQRSAVLAGDADRVRPLFRKARAVENETPRRSGSTSNNRRQIRSASHVACVMKCCSP